jgi:hypothetical protein
MIDREGMQHACTAMQNSIDIFWNGRGHSGRNADDAPYLFMRDYPAIEKAGSPGPTRAACGRRKPEHSATPMIG